MNSREALGRLRALRIAAVTTADAAAVLGLSIEAASHTLRRLGDSGLLTPVRKGLWALSERPDALALAEYITAPYPSYVSLQSALYLHGMVDQVPARIYIVSLARTGEVRTALGTYSVHHVRPELFGGAALAGDSETKLASPEKALVDYLYLSPSRSRLFAALPELALPKTFSPRAARKWAGRIPCGRLRTIVERKLDEVLGGRSGKQGRALAPALAPEGAATCPARLSLQREERG
jgi:DNA-binding transcriptional ArsR family regulator